jgi:hypothetical protein
MNSNFAIVACQVFCACIVAAHIIVLIIIAKKYKK